MAKGGQTVTPRYLVGWEPINDVAGVATVPTRLAPAEPVTETEMDHHQLPIGRRTKVGLLKGRGHEIWFG